MDSLRATTIRRENSISTDETKVKKVFVIRRSIFLIFVFFSSLIMLLNLTILVFGLCYSRLIKIIDDGARPPILLNIEIMAEAGATIAADAMAQSYNDLLIMKSLTQSYIDREYTLSGLRMLQEEPETSTSDLTDETSEPGTA